VPRRKSRIALYDADGRVIPRAQYMYVGDETPMPGLRIDLPRVWFVHEVVASGVRILPRGCSAATRTTGGTMICHPNPPD